MQRAAPDDAIWLALARISAIEQRIGRVGSGPPAWLSVSERQRLERITAAGRRTQFIAGRWLLRQLLRPLLPGQACSITASDNAPPRLESPEPGGEAPALHLSLSHSGDWVCCGV